MRFPFVLACGAAVGAVEPVSCGPTLQEQGQAVLIAAPLVVLGAMAAQWLLLALWRRRWSDVALRWRPGLAVVAVLGVASLATAFAAPKGRQWAGVAFWLFGCSYAAVLLVVTRVWLLFGPRARRHAFLLPHLVPLVTLVGAAGMAAAGMLSEARDVVEALWTTPGFGGWVAGPLYAGLLLEAWLRTRRRAVDGNSIQ